MFKDLYSARSTNHILIKHVSITLIGTIFMFYMSISATASKCIRLIVQQRRQSVVSPMSHYCYGLPLNLIDAAHKSCFMMRCLIEVRPNDRHPLHQLAYKMAVNKDIYTVNGNTAFVIALTTEGHPW